MSRKPAAVARVATKEAGPRSGPFSRLLGLKRSDEAAFELLYRRHHQEIYRYCLAILRSHEDAEDALQATMAAALRSLPGESRTIAVRPWLFRVAHNEAISAIRRRRETVEMDESQGPFTDSAEVQLADREQLRRLVADLRSLPERQRSALVMRELSGLSYEEIGGALASSEGAVRQTVFEARSALADLAEGREMDCEDVRRMISARDGRRLRGRRIRAHLAGCDGCSGFAASIGQRRSDLEALCPPLPLIAATSLLSGLLGSGGGAGAGAAAAGATGGAAGAGVGGGLAASAGVKGASLIAAGALVLGAGEVTGVIDVPGIGQGSSGSNAASPGGATPSDGAADAVPGENDVQGSEVRGPEAPGGGSRGRGDGSRRSQNASGRGGSPGRSSSAVGQRNGSGHSEDAPGKAGSSPGQSGETPGQSGSSPGQSGSTPGQSGSNPPGQAGTSPGQAGTSPGQAGTSPGQAGTSPGQAGTAPGQAATGLGSGQPAAPAPGGGPPPGRGNQGG